MSASPSPRVLIVVGDATETVDTLYPYYRLQEAGFEPVVIAPEQRTYQMVLHGARLYDSGEECGPQANAAKFLGAKAGFEACTQAVLTHGGMGYAKEYQVERLLREVMIARLAPVSEQLILSHIAENVLDLPKSY